nr:MAG: lipopolysaccharide-dodifying enzyme [Diabrotica toursvirus 3a]
MNLNIFNCEVKENNFLPSEVMNTIEYLHERYGSAIYIRISDNKLSSFNRVHNSDYVNYWQWRIADGKQKGKVFFEGYDVGLLDNYYIKDFKIQSNVDWIKKLLSLLCERRRIPDCEFFINSERMYPVINSNKNLADKIFNTLPDDLIPDNLHTVFSFTTSKDFNDIPFPTFEDYERIMNSTFGIENYKSMKWEDKISEFVFRGHSVSENNLREKLVTLLMNNSAVENVNVGITTFKYVPILETLEITIPNPNPRLLNYHIEKSKLSKSKFIFAVDGIGVYEDIASLMFTGSCILKINSKWENWFTRCLIPGVHYLEISENLDNVHTVMNWCVNNDEKCKEIGINSRTFATKLLSTNGILDYMQKVITEIPRATMFEVTRSEIQLEFQKQFLSQNITPDVVVNFSLLTEIYEDRLNYGSNKALEMLDYRGDVRKFTTEEDVVNHTFIGKKCINYLAKEIPNFRFVYGYKGMVAFEERLINTKPIKDFLLEKPKKKNIILIQIHMALQVAYERYCFYFNKKNKEDFLVHKLKHPISIVYRLNCGNWVLKTKYVVIINNYSNCVVLDNFKISPFNKNKRIFIGQIITNMTDVPDEPFSVLKKTVSAADIKKSKIKFGIVKEDLPIPEYNPRLIYDKITGTGDCHQKVYERVFKNEFPKEESQLGNCILKYEMTQNLHTTLADLNMNVNADIVLSSQLQKCADLINLYYDKLIDKTKNIDFIFDDSTDLYGIQTVIKKYLKLCAIKITSKIQQIIKSTIKDSISLGIRNTELFYAKKD